MTGRLITAAFAPLGLAASADLMAQPVGISAPPPKVSPAQGAIDLHVHSEPDVFGRSMDDMITGLLKEGIAQADIDLMVKKNPARLRGLE
jgi:hypothetical protein